MDPFNITYLGAFGAGLLSFVAPCVLPLIPAYLCFLGGASLEELTAEGGVDKAVQKRVFTAAVAFVLGFSTVFIFLGATATTIGQWLAEYKSEFALVAGVVIAVFGLHYMGIFRIGFLNVEKRFHIQNKPSSLLGSYILGLAFAFGWTPCVGPVLSTILLFAGSQDEVQYGMSLLAVYAAGIGIPFLIAAFAVKPFMGFLGRFRKHMHKVEVTIGSLMVVTGIAISTGMINAASNWIYNTFSIFTEIG